MRERIHSRLRELRQEYGLTQEQLAKALDVTRHTILALEVGRYVPSIELALRLAAFFDCPLESVFWLPPDEEAAMRGAIHRLTGTTSGGGRDDEGGPSHA